MPHKRTPASGGHSASREGRRFGNFSWVCEQAEIKKAAMVVVELGMGAPQ